MEKRLDSPESATEVTRKQAKRPHKKQTEKDRKQPSAQIENQAIYAERGYAMIGQEEIQDDGGAWAYQEELEHHEQEALRHGQSTGDRRKAKMEVNYFAELARLDVSEFIEKKGQFSYLSWTWAIDRLRRTHPDATWEVKRFNNAPFMKTECGYFVEVSVKVDGVTLSQIHPVLDSRNRPILEPNAFDINTSIQRCLVKAIALHGLGLYIYAGEDLPEGVEPTRITEDQQVTLEHLINEVGSDPVKFLNYFKIETLADLPAADYERALAALEKKRKAAA